MQELLLKSEGGHNLGRMQYMHYIMFLEYSIVSFSSEAVGDGITEARDPEACRSHLELDHLGRVLKAIRKRSPGISACMYTKIYIILW